MLTVTLVMLLIGIVLCGLAAGNYAPLWAAVFILYVLELARVIPFGR